MEATQVKQDAAFKATWMTDQHSPEFSVRMKEMFDAVFNCGVARGRKSTVANFRDFFAAKPSQARTEMWLQDQTSLLEGMRVKGNAESDAIRVQKPGDTPASQKDYVIKALEAVAYNGIVRGAADETQLIDQNLGSYFRAKSAADQQRRANRARIFGAIGSALSGAASVPPMQPSAPVMVTCHTYYSGTVCTGR